MKILIALFFLFTTTLHAQPIITDSMANKLAALPLKCIQQQYPNKLGQLLADSTELAEPRQLHPAFYGCFDWHSAVHGHWSLVYLLHHYPALQQREKIIALLQQNLSSTNIAVEIAYLQKKHERSFERTYGWAWLLKLQQELDNATEPALKPLATNLRPLTQLLVERYIGFLPRLLYPLRVGTHSNTAFGLSFAYDYAIHARHTALRDSIIKHATRYFYTDAACPLNWEPSGTDFLSPCMEEIHLMQRILPRQKFLLWAKKFAPTLFQKNFSWAVARVSDRADGHLVHLDGLNFSRAWCFFSLAKKFPAQLGHLKKLGLTHFNYSLPAITDGNYEGEHWLASFALCAAEQGKK